MYRASDASRGEEVGVGCKGRSGVCRIERLMQATEGTQLRRESARHGGEEESLSCLNQYGLTRGRHVVLVNALAVGI